MGNSKRLEYIESLITNTILKQMSSVKVVFMGTESP